MIPNVFNIPQDILTGTIRIANLEGQGATLLILKNLLLISSLLSLLIGTIGGLSQIKVKRLLAFSSITHVGFLLLALSIYTQNSIDSFIFYLVQYSITSLNMFLIILAFGYLRGATKTIFSTQPKERLNSAPGTGSLATRRQDINKPSENALLSGTDANALQSAGPVKESRDINYLSELKGELFNNPVLSVTFAICLFSMAGIPPLIGFFSKQFVLFSSIENGFYFLSIVAILVSVISASYYLKLIKLTFFDDANLFSGAVPTLFNKNLERGEHLSVTLNFSISQMHIYLISILSSIILLFFIDPTIILNGTQLISLTIFNL